MAAIKPVHIYADHSNLSDLERRREYSTYGNTEMQSLGPLAPSRKFPGELLNLEFHSPSQS